jgi:hypothetical protein
MGNDYFCNSHPVHCAVRFPRRAGVCACGGGGSHTKPVWRKGFFAGSTRSTLPPVLSVHLMLTPLFHTTHPPQTKEPIWKLLVRQQSAGRYLPPSSLLPFPPSSLPLPFPCSCLLVACCYNIHLPAPKRVSSFSFHAGGRLCFCTGHPPRTSHDIR